MCTGGPALAAARPPRSSRAPRRGFSLIAAACLLMGSCASTAARAADARGDGHWPRAKRWKEAAVHALRDPATWSPAAGAAVIGLVDDWDRKISDWAVDRTPVFGSPDRAKTDSNYLRTASGVAMIASSLAVPGTDDPWGSRLGRLFIEEMSRLPTDGATLLLKRTTNRERPDASDRESFPSAHASSAFDYAAMSARNFHDMNLSTGARVGWDVGVFTLASGTAWARVEGGVHFPSDVLAGAALGNFFGRLVHDAFLERSDRSSLEHGGGSSVAVCLAPRDSYLVVTLRF